MPHPNDSRSRRIKAGLAGAIETALGATGTAVWAASGYEVVRDDNALSVRVAPLVGEAMSRHFRIEIREVM